MSSVGGSDPKPKISVNPFVQSDSVVSNQSPVRVEESKNDIYIQNLVKGEENYKSSGSLSDYEDEEEEYEVEEEEEDEECQFSYLINQNLDKSEDQSSITVIGNHRMQERIEQTVVQDATKVYKIKLRHRQNMSPREENFSSSHIDSELKGKSFKFSCYRRKR